MSEHDEIEEAIRGIVGYALAEDTRQRLEALFAERPRLVDALLPDGWRVIRFTKRTAPPFVFEEHMSELVERLRKIAGLDEGRRGPRECVECEAADRIEALEYELAQTVAEADGCWTMCGEHARRIEALERENRRLREVVKVVAEWADDEPDIRDWQDFARAALAEEDKT